MNGVVHTTVGCTGGMETCPTHKQILDHTESILVECGPVVVSHEELCKKWSKIIEGKLGKSARQCWFAMWFLNDAQKALAESTVKELLEQESGKPSDVAVEAATRFYGAEEYHDHFLISSAFRMLITVTALIFCDLELGFFLANDSSLQGPTSLSAIMSARTQSKKNQHPFLSKSNTSTGFDLISQIAYVGEVVWEDFAATVPA